jgi:hypothetical protein
LTGTFPSRRKSSPTRFILLPQTAKQRPVENALFEMGTSISEKLGVDRRQFFPMTCGMAAGFAAIVFGHFFKVDTAELHDVAAGNPTPSNTQYGWVRR